MSSFAQDIVTSGVFDSFVSTFHAACQSTPNSFRQSMWKLVHANPRAMNALIFDWLNSNSDSLRKHGLLIGEPRNKSDVAPESNVSRVAKKHSPLVETRDVATQDAESRATKRKRDEESSVDDAALVAPAKIAENKTTESALDAQTFEKSEESLASLTKTPGKKRIEGEKSKEKNESKSSRKNNGKAKTARGFAESDAHGVSAARGSVSKKSDKKNTDRSCDVEE